MIRGWILLSSLVLSVLFKLWPDYSPALITFPFSEKTLNTQSWVYYFMEHIIAIAVAGVILINDHTPRWLLVLFFILMVVDLLHFILFYRDEGIGFNLIKVIIFGLPLLYLELKTLWRHLSG